MIVNCRNGVSSWEILAHIGNHSEVRMVYGSQNPACVAVRLHYESRREPGEVEADETFIGGKARNMHKAVKARRITGTEW